MVSPVLVSLSLSVYPSFIHISLGTMLGANVSFGTGSAVSVFNYDRWCLPSTISLFQFFTIRLYGFTLPPPPNKLSDATWVWNCTLLLKNSCQMCVLCHFLRFSYLQVLQLAIVQYTCICMHALVFYGLWAKHYYSYTRNGYTRTYFQLINVPITAMYTLVNMYAL